MLSAIYLYLPLTGEMYRTSSHMWITSSIIYRFYYTASVYRNSSDSNQAL